jgi:hypothetical protein
MVVECYRGAMVRRVFFKWLGLVDKQIRGGHWAGVTATDGRPIHRQHYQK